MILLFLSLSLSTPLKNFPFLSLPLHWWPKPSSPRRPVQFIHLIPLFPVFRSSPSPSSGSAPPRFCSWVITSSSSSAVSTGNESKSSAASLCPTAGKRLWFSGRRWSHVGWTRRRSDWSHWLITKNPPASAPFVWANFSRRSSWEKFRSAAIYFTLIVSISGFRIILIAHSVEQESRPKIGQFRPMKRLKLHPLVQIPAAPSLPRTRILLWLNWVTVTTGSILRRWAPASHRNREESLRRLRVWGMSVSTWERRMRNFQCNPSEGRFRWILPATGSCIWRCRRRCGRTGEHVRMGLRVAVAEYGDLSFLLVMVEDQEIQFYPFIFKFKKLCFPFFFFFLLIFIIVLWWYRL